MFDRPITRFNLSPSEVIDISGGDVLRVQSGTTDSAFDRVLRETSAHYLPGVEVADSDRDGGAHNISVQVKRRGLWLWERPEERTASAILQFRAISDCSCPP